MSTQNIQAPAKINLFLAVTGKRSDGYHDLVSVVAPLAWGDSIEVEDGGGSFGVTADDPEVPVGAANLITKAAEAFAAESGWPNGARFRITKRIPMGSGLGGASSDATSALLALNTLSGGLLDSSGLLRVAAKVGSDCPLFLSQSPVIMRGRGERIEPLPKEAYSRIRGMRVLVFKPEFSVPTPWAYAKLAEGAPASYVTPARAESMLASWMARTSSPVGELAFNSMEAVIFAKFVALPVLLGAIRDRFGICGRMSGSGSACYLLLDENTGVRPIEAMIREALGPSAFIVETRIA